MDKKGPGVGDQTIGMGGTTQWKLASLVNIPTFSFSCLPPLSKILTWQPPLMIRKLS
jgi:hypothetical protein